MTAGSMGAYSGAADWEDFSRVWILLFFYATERSSRYSTYYHIPGINLSAGLIPFEDIRVHPIDCFI